MVFLDVEVAVEAGHQNVKNVTGWDKLYVLGVMELVEMICVRHVLDQDIIQRVSNVILVMELANYIVAGAVVQDILTVRAAMVVEMLYVMNAMVMENCVASRVLEKERQKRNAHNAMVVG